MSLVSDNNPKEQASDAQVNPNPTPVEPVVQGAKRRKPQKTNRVTQQQQSEAIREERDEDRDEVMVISEEPVAPSPEPEEEIREDVVDDQPVFSSRSDDQPLAAEPIVPPGPIPKPIISTTTVVTSNAENSYVCPLCHDTLKSQKDFTTHIRGHNEVKPHPDPNDPTGQAKVYYCCLCGKMLSSFSSLDRHMLVHSGERPFSCELCGQTFTTNGNMHRHKRTHSAKELQEFGEAMGISISTGSGRRAGRKRKKDSAKADEDIVDEKKSSPLLATSQPLLRPTCPKCGESFFSENILESHIRSVHAGESFKCDQCSFTFANYNMLQMHKLFHNPTPSSAPQPAASYIMTPSTPKVSMRPVVATTASIDFSPQHFPQLAKAILSKNEELTNGGTSSFGNATSAFKPDQCIVNPSQERALSPVHSDITTQKPADMAESAPEPEGSGFKSSLEEDDDNCDALDIANGSLPIDSHGDNDPQIRDMKLKGEFPCRLCPAIYPNLRALKGHNKEHLNKAPYECNVGTCTYSSSDKSTLTRHMRTHTGEKPYECKLCCYGFTTKANCERHLKNKHGKSSREQIRENLIIHETEETLGNSNSGDGLSPLKFPTEGMNKESGNFRCKVCKQLFPSSVKVIAHAIKDHPAYSSDVDHIFEELKGRSTSTVKAVLGDLSAPSMVPRLTTFPSLASMRPLFPTQDGTKDSDNEDESEEERTGASEETPLDLSQPSVKGDEEASKEMFASAAAPSSTLLPPTLEPSLRDELMKNNAALSMGLFPSFLYPGNTPVRPGAMIPGAPFPFGLNPAAAAAAAALMTAATPGAFNFLPPVSATMDLKQPLQPMLEGGAGLAQLSSQGKTTTPFGPASHPIGPNDIAAYLVAQQELLRKQQPQPQPQPLGEKRKLKADGEELKMSTSLSPTSPNGSSSCNESQSKSDLKDNSDSDSNYKMVIQNGVLMKKQKQRRYRTERPYGCDHCNARFTLRSNMERHIKQQHPEHWSSKPRGSRRNHAATVPVLAPQYRSSSADEATKNGVNSEQETLVIDETTKKSSEEENGVDLASVSRLLNTASNHSFKKFFDRGTDSEQTKSNDEPQAKVEDGEDDEVASSEADIAEPSAVTPERKKSAYSAAPHKISCPYCQRKFPWTSSLKRHILTHTGHKPYKCSYCSLTFTTKSNCDRHQVRKHGATNNNDQGFTTRNVSERPYKCPKCPSSTFSSQKNLVKHEYSVHLNVEYPHASSDDEGDDFDEDEEDMDQDGEEVTFHCHLCDEAFPDRSEAIGHLQISHAEDYEKLINDGAFTEEVQPKQEDEYEGGEEDEDAKVEDRLCCSCLFCTAKFTNRADLKKHVRKHTGERPFECDICQKRFQLKQTLMRHRKKHDSGVSSDSSQSEDEAVVSKNDEPGKTVVKTNGEVAKRKKANLMDTIARLSSGKQGGQEGVGVETPS